MGVSLLSVASGFVLVFRMGTSEILPSVPTGELLAFLALMVLPGLALWALVADRSVRAGHFAAQAGSGASRAPSIDEQVVVAPATESETAAADEGQDWPEHDAHGRPSPERHRRRAEVVTRQTVPPSIRRAG